jgi:hypothetical protein
LNFSQRCDLRTAGAGCARRNRRSKALQIPSRSLI